MSDLMLRLDQRTLERNEAHAAEAAAEGRLKVTEAWVSLSICKQGWGHDAMQLHVHCHVMLLSTCAEEQCGFRRANQTCGAVQWGSWHHDSLQLTVCLCVLMFVQALEADMQQQASSALAAAEAAKAAAEAKLKAALADAAEAAGVFKSTRLWCTPPRADQAALSACEVSCCSA